jgi:hypothetical protein
MTPLQKAQQIEFEKVQKENELMKRLSTREGFFKFYYQECKNFETNKQAFDHTNEMYFDLFGQYRFADYISFKNMVTYYNKKN